MLQDIDEAEGVAAVKEAFDLGINFFDTSPYYGDTKSETVRRLFQRVGRELGGVWRGQSGSHQCWLSLGVPLACVCGAGAGARPGAAAPRPNRGGHKGRALRRRGLRLQVMGVDGVGGLRKDAYLPITRQKHHCRSYALITTGP